MIGPWVKITQVNINNWLFMVLEVKISKRWSTSFQGEWFPFNADTSSLLNPWQNLSQLLALFDWRYDGRLASQLLVATCCSAHFSRHNLITFWSFPMKIQSTSQQAQNRVLLNCTYSFKEINQILWVLQQVASRGLILYLFLLWIWNWRKGESPSSHWMKPFY